MAQQITIDIVAETKKLREGVETANQQLGTVEKGLKGLTATALAAASAFVLREGVTFLKQGIDEAKEAAETMRAATSTFGQGSKALEQITEDATKFGDAIAVDNDAIIQLATQLGSRLPKEAQALSAQLVNTFFDVEAFTGGALKAEAITGKLGKAFADGVLKAGELEKIFPALTAKTYDQAEALSKAGKNTEALTLLIGESQKKYGQAAEANVTSSQKFDVALANLKETIGTKLLPFLEKAIDFFTQIIDKFSKLSPATQNFIIGLTAIVGIGAPLLTFLANLKTALISLTGIQVTATAAQTGLTTATTAGTAATGLATTATTLFSAALRAIPIVLIISLIALLITNFDKVKEVAGKVADFLGTVFDKAINAIKTVINKIADILPNWLKKLLGIDGQVFTFPAPSSQSSSGGSGMNSASSTLGFFGKRPFEGKTKTDSKATKDSIVIPTITETKTLKDTVIALDKASKVQFDSQIKSVNAIQAMTQAIRERESRGDTFNINLNTLQPTAETGKAIVQSIKEFTNRGGNFDRISAVAI